jgi:ubiquinone biosynthesis protein
MRTLLRHPHRVWQVLAVFFRSFISPALHLPRSDRRSGPVRMRSAFEELGGAWVKLGQMLALRFDLLPEEYCDELFGLLNQVAPFSYAEVRGIIRSELGGEPETVFRSFAPESFAAASIGQVHRATLHSGEQVAVKVQRPGIRETRAGPATSSTTSSRRARQSSSGSMPRATRSSGSPASTATTRPRGC